MLMSETISHFFLFILFAEFQPHAARQNNAIADFVQLRRRAKARLRPRDFRHCLRQTRSVCAREHSDEAIHLPVMPRYGLLRGACHRAGIRPTRWLATTRGD